MGITMGWTSNMDWKGIWVKRENKMEWRCRDKETSVT
jgi:hypothetical protein